MSTILLSYFGACFVFAVAVVAAGFRWRQNKDRLLKADEAHLDSACEGALLTELSDFAFARSGK